MTAVLGSVPHPGFQRSLTTVTGRERRSWHATRRERRAAAALRRTSAGPSPGVAAGPTGGSSASRKTRSAVRRRRPPAARSGTPRSSARPRTVQGRQYGSFARPRCGCGVRNGASVSTSSWSAGTSRGGRAQRGGVAEGDRPGERQHVPGVHAQPAPSPRPRRSSGRSPSSGAPSSRRMRSTSSCASRSWIISGLPSRLARSMCRRKDSLLGGRRRVVPVVVQPGLADRDHPRVGGQPLDLGVLVLGDARRCASGAGRPRPRPARPSARPAPPSGPRPGRRRP